MKRFINKQTNWVGEGTLRSLTLVILILISMVYGIVGVVQGIGIGFLSPIIFIAAFFGWALASTQIPGRSAIVIHILAGFGWILWRVGSLGGAFATLVDTIIQYGKEAVQNRIIPEASALQVALNDLISDVSVLFSRVYLWLISFFDGDPNFDPVALAFVWGLSMWGVASWTSWGVRRWSKPVVSGIPAVLILGYSLAYANGNTFFLLPMLTFWILLIIVIRQDVREYSWMKTGVMFPERIRKNVTLVAIMVSMSLVTAAAISPKISLERLFDFVQRFNTRQATGNSLETSLGLEADSERVISVDPLLNDEGFGTFRDGGLPASHLVSSGSELSGQVVMVITVEDDQAISETGDSAWSDKGYYWRSLIYDEYNGTGWSTSAFILVTYPLGEYNIPTSLPGRRLLRSQVNILEDRNGLLYFSGNLLAADNNYRAAWRAQFSFEDFPDLFGAIIDSSSYQVVSSVQNFSETELRSASQDYPVEIGRPYLNLPPTVPERVISLALELTATEPTAYDRAIAIETYLRGFPYTLDLPPTPNGENIDIADYFLFALKKGYCDYYATTMVVLARAAGLPARIVYGYIGGNYDEENNRYIITEDLAHSWVEIFFPDFGWIEFEPTAGRPMIERPEQALPEIPPDLDIFSGFEAPPEDESNLIDPEASSYWMVWVRRGIGLLMFGVGVLLTWPLVDIWLLGFLAPRKTVAVIFRRLYRQATPLGVTTLKGKTPFEFAEGISEQFVQLLAGKRADYLVKSSVFDISWLTEQFVQVRYSAYIPEDRVKQTAILKWKRLRWQILSAKWEAWRSRWDRLV